MLVMPRSATPINTMYKLSAFILSLVLLAACSKEQQLKRKIDGSYTVKNFSLQVQPLPGCNETGYTSFSVDQPGKMVFTGKKTIDGPVSSASSRPYWGYLDYDFTTTNHDGKPVDYTERTYFQYEIVDGSGANGDTSFAAIFFDGVRYPLEIVYDGNKVAAFKYRVQSGNACLRAEQIHTVR